MKKALIIALLCVNAGLLTALVVAGTSPAKAQVIPGQTDYLMITSTFDSNYDAAFVIDMAKQQMAAIKVDKTSKKLVAYPIVDLRNDLKRGM